MIAAGGRGIVDLSSGGLGPDPLGLVEIARATGAHVIMGCGHYVHDYQDPANAARTVEDLAEEIVDSVEVGVWGTDVRAGIIGEIGCSAPWTALEQRVMVAAVLAQRQTGAAINVHPGRHPDQPQEVADFVRVKGGRMERVIISHIDRTVFDADRLGRLADAGCVLEWDLFGQEASYYRLADIDLPNDAVRLRAIRGLIDRGHLDQVLISHDICYRSRLVRWGGHGYGHIFANVVPLMRRRGFSEREIQAVLVDNPRRLLTIA
jgi:phosphotriesterase-related protein